MTRTSAFWDREEFPLPRNMILYSELKEELERLQAINPGMMKIEVVGRSARGRDLYLVIIANEQTMADIENYRHAIRNAVNDPKAAITSLQNGIDYKAPFLVNSGIHGNEGGGVDASLRIIEKMLLNPAAPETAQILDNLIVLFNLAMNPDGRVNHTRDNAEFVDLNRDAMTQSQPETQALIQNVGLKWFPTASLDMHGWVGGIVDFMIEPSTPPYNPNVEHDLFTHKLQTGRSMAVALKKETGLPALIPLEHWKEGWDEYTTVMPLRYLQLVGTAGLVIEDRFPTEQGLKATVAVTWANLLYVAVNKEDMLLKQFEFYLRGVEGRNERTDIQFPFAYIIPLEPSLQKNAKEAKEMVAHLQKNCIEVKQVTREFVAGKVTYPEGTIIVPMQQGLRGLANALLWSGEDLRKLNVQMMYDVAVYSFPLFAGFDAIPAWEEFLFNGSDEVAVEAFPGIFKEALHGDFVIACDHNDAITAANHLVQEGYDVSRFSKEHGYVPAGSFLIKKQEGLSELLLTLCETLSIRVEQLGDIQDVTLLPVKLRKIAVITGDNNGAYFSMKKMGFDVTPVSYHLLNMDYDLEAGGFDAIVVAGSKRGLWEDTGEYVHAYSVFWGLTERGRQKIIDFIAKGRDFIGIGFAGIQINKTLGLLDVDFAYPNDAVSSSGWTPDDGPDPDAQTTENGIIKIDADTNHPLSFSFGKNETVYAYGPVWFPRVSEEVGVASSFAQGDTLISGFWLAPEKAGGQPMIIYNKEGKQKVVLMGIDPTFRNYTPATFRLMANAFYWLGYE
ncbi:M14 family zinc carboxypeptidase [Brevibacillus reuszeri]|uniref:M14 family zinc carboxypeptidase n=1 Tax=Brevibacillus reuszeri TaxID=54915 RepID=UPI000CCC2A4C|nr:M14 family zinc carboxypeptidase [Brevibacillus reuszeri]